MYQTLTPFETKFIEQDRKHLEVIVLFVTYYINHLINRVIGKTKFSRTDILSHVDRSTVTTEKELMIQSFGSQVGPYGTVFFLVEETFFQTFHYLFFSFEVSIGFIIDLVKANPHLLVGFVESCIYPVVHHFPQSAYFRITGFPLHQHFAGFLHQWRFSFSLCFRFIATHSLRCKFSHQLLYFRFIMLIERYIIITYQVVTLLTRSFRSFTVSVFLPCQHGLTDVDTTVVYNICFDYLIAVCRYNVSQCVA